MPKYISIEDVRRQFAAAEIPAEVLTHLLSAHRVRRDRRKAGDRRRVSATDYRQGLRLRSTPTRWNPRVRRFHPGDVRDAITEIGHARERSTATGHRENGEFWIPASVVKSKYGFNAATALGWHARRKKRCPWLDNKPVAANLWLAKHPKGRFLWVWFYSRAEIRKARNAQKAGQRTDWRTKAPKKVKEYKRPDPDLWADTAEAMKTTGATGFQILYLWHHKGFLAPGGVRLPLKKEHFNLPRAEGGRKVVWWRDHLKAIGEERTKLRPVADGLDRLAPYVDRRNLAARTLREAAT